MRQLLQDSAPSPDVFAHSSKALSSSSHAGAAAADGAEVVNTKVGAGVGGGATGLEGIEGVDGVLGVGEVHVTAAHTPSLKQLSKAVFSASQLPHSGQVSMAVHE